MCNQKLKIFAWPNQQKLKNGLAPIYYRISIDSKRVVIATKHYVDTSHWNAKQERLKGSAPNSDKINAIIDRAVQSMKQHYLDMGAIGKKITSIELKNKFLGIEVIDTPKYKTICDAFDYHNIKMQEMVDIGRITRKTLLRYKSSKQKTIDYMKINFKVSDKPLPEIRLSFLTEFEHYLLTREKLHGNTAHKIIKILKKIMNLAVALDWIGSSPFNQFKCSYKNPERIVITQEELDILILKNFNLVRLEEVRDVFIFCCYTGFAYTDIYHFEQNAEMIGLDGNYWLSTMRQKTGTSEKVPLLPIALEIIRKYKKQSFLYAKQQIATCK